VRFQWAERKCQPIEVNLGALKRQRGVGTARLPHRRHEPADPAFPRYRSCFRRNYDLDAFPAEGAARGDPQPRSPCAHPRHGHV
jgi:hypothetical protein